MKVAAIDIGTNSFLCLIAQTKPEGARLKIERILEDKVKIVRLGQGLSQQPLGQKKFLPEALERAKNCMQEFRKSIDQHQVEKVLAVATSATRDVQNAEELLKIAKNLSIPIQIISGEQEAKLSFFGAVGGNHNDNQIPKDISVLDIGGGSTELISYEGSNTIGKSLDIGAVRLTEKFISAHPISEEELSELKNFVHEQVKNFSKSKNSIKQKLMAVAGTPTTLAMVMQSLATFEENKINGFQIDKRNLQKIIEKMKNMSLAEKKKMVGMDPGRADILLTGAVILEEVLEYLKIETATVSTRGLRYGVIECLM